MTRRDYNDPNGIGDEIKAHIAILGTIVAAMWLLEFVDIALGGRLNYLGIYPRSTIGLRGILLAPFLHLNFQHLISNTIPFVVMGWFVMLRGIPEFFKVSVIVALASGIGTWLFGSAGLHIGASGVVFGYFGFLLSRAYFERSSLSIALSLAVGLLYGGLIWGVLPGRFGISWEGHLFGFLGGIYAARELSRR
ncbi:MULTISPECIES: rhomboid family intramembrane serine protease [Leptolyngbya]|jgi:membrane associated rhomboid family serine protease|uniref:Peptidase n=2 Tax=Leptolyngbya boryana TaxID=1184 RepID=A0A1Z4JII2_LEPBY|nr:MULTISPECIES: rhomboid family intramembrane serine protease [Leptolyngbya]BAY56526.1 peptidase [Leptolyngbya boryana NIES-2135]MBD1857782.1 rhomboid family intramembrane serine protease [Leptolyngbya sp. FACHB-1624]MBD2369831.1 rhomboid family intramembrane serine protease [Leptolyngbya sp. FACHB-161]MBD2376224.1 rhomboid family intramembrane serine protease [Leptolyngbya sp. FACHB-238]MBD2400499.1 rhomboid family intramembrane serine protease [Leptolyngbya sp. FACHB-239]